MRWQRLAALPLPGRSLALGQNRSPTDFGRRTEATLQISAFLDGMSQICRPCAAIVNSKACASSAKAVPWVSLLVVSLLVYLSITVETVLLDKSEAQQLAHALFIVSSQDFIGLYTRHVPPLGTLAMQYLHLFEPPRSCSFIQWVIKREFRRSELYLSLLEEHARPGVKGLSSDRQPEIHTALGFQRVVPCGLSPQEDLAQAPQITDHLLPTSLSGVGLEHHVSDRIVRQRQDHLKWFEHKANQIK